MEDLRFIVFLILVAVGIILFIGGTLRLVTYGKKDDTGFMFSVTGGFLLLLSLAIIAIIKVTSP